VAFNRDPIFPPLGAGTKENPIEVCAASPLLFGLFYR
jgi:hypothetical protein